MATVYLARAHGIHGFERQVALKLMHPHLHLDASWSSQFLAEAKIAAGITHPNVVPVTDVGDDEVGLYLVMDYVEGDSLAGLVKEAAARGERVPFGVGLRILVDALAGLHAAHELRASDGAPLHLVHRDFSPHNVLVGTDGIARLSDFGVAKTSEGDQTRSGVVKGKLFYMSPEQLAAKPLDRRADVWAAGVMAWEIATGKRLYPPQPDEMAIMVRIASSRPPRASTVWPGVPRAIDDAIADALAPKAADRLPTAEALRTRLLDSGLVADHEEVARYVTAAAESRVTRLREQSGARTPAVRANAAEPTSQAVAGAAEMIMDTRVEPAIARRRSKHTVGVLLVGLAMAGAGGLVMLRASFIRRAVTPASASIAPTSAAASFAIDTTSPPVPSASTVAAASIPPAAPAPPVPLLPSPVRPSRSKPAPRTGPVTASTAQASPARRPLLADPLDGH
jgi:hypothetical protein